MRCESRRCTAQLHQGGVLSRGCSPLTRFFRAAVHTLANIFTGVANACRREARGQEAWGQEAYGQEAWRQEAWGRAAWGQNQAGKTAKIKMGQAHWRLAHLKAGCGGRI